LSKKRCAPKRGPIDETIERWEKIIGLCEKSSVRGEKSFGQPKNTSVLALSTRGLCEKDVGLGEKETGLLPSSDVCATFDDGLSPSPHGLSIFSDGLAQ
jgi:hypothetical protein